MEYGIIYFYISTYLQKKYIANKANRT